MLKKCRSSLLRSHRMLKSVARACPGATAGSKSAARACSGATECSKSVARACPGATAGSKSDARAHSREVRSFLALEKCCLLFVCYRPPLLLGSTLLRRAQSCWGVRLGRSSPLGVLRPRPGKAERNEPTRTSQAYPETLRRAGPRMPVALRARSASLGETLRRAGPRMPVALLARSASLGRSNWPLEPARPWWGARQDRA